MGIAGSALTRLRFTPVLAAAIALACGGSKVPEAIKEPLLVAPAGARLVLVADVRTQRDLNNFIDFWDFLRNRDRDTAYRNRLPFDYQEFVSHWRLDPVRDIDKAIHARYDGGAWVTVLVGQYEPDHLTGLLREHGIVSTTQRGGTGEVAAYGVTEVRASQGDVENWVGVGVSALSAAPFLGAVAAVLQTSDVPRETVFNAWPTHNIWIRSNDPTLMGQALDLWDGTGSDDLLGDSAFSQLYRARPHSALVWAGMPRSSGLPSPLSTAEVELDIRDYFTPTVILGFDTADAADAAFPEWERIVQELRDGLARLPQLASDSLSADAMTGLARWAQRSELLEILVALGGRLRIQIVRPQRIIEFAAPLPINDFKTVLITLTRELMS